MKKGVMCMLFVLVLMFPLFAQGTKDAAPSDAMSGVLNVWSSGEELGRFVENFNKVYPNIEVKITVVPNSEFVAKITPALAGGQGPDIFTGESDYVKYFVNAGVWQDLRQAPYSCDQYTGDLWDYVRSVGTDSSGAVRALSWQASPGSLIYRRDLAQKVLGVSEPAEVAKHLNSNQAMLQAAAAFKAQGIKMFASWEDIMNMQFSNRKSPWVVAGKLSIDPSMVEFMDMAKTITEKGYDLGVSPWAPEWMAAVEGNDCFCYVLPTWGYQFVVKPSAATTIGKWGLSQGAVPYVKGGTWLGINKDSKKKDMAWAFIKYVTLDSEAQIAYARKYSEYVSLKSADAALATGPGEEVLGGQNLFAFYNDQMAKIPSDLMTQYDGQLNNAFLSVVRSYATGKLTKDAALQQFVEDARTAYPELSF
jgi:ABC-type glycerol-3-phosphate transport system substrate-binding protein